MSKNVLTITALFAGLVLSGCATVKPEMPEEKYSSIAKAFASLNYCVQQGWMAPDVGAKGMQLLRNNINQYTFNTNKIESTFQKEEPNNNRLAQGDCNIWATQILTNSQNTTPVSNYNEQQEYINSTKSKQTYCNRIGTQTFCNTY